MVFERETCRLQELMMCAIGWSMDPTNRDLLYKNGLRLLMGHGVGHVYFEVLNIPTYCPTFDTK